MRNLKRALSLAMASVMLLGMMVVGTGASYADVDSADNVEAIEVMQAIGVMVGDTNGNFNPDQKVTRVEMAVVMSNLLDLKVEDFVGASIPFTDVPEWAVPYVAACYADGITAGISATQYGSNYEVTTAQAALMMMKALGYFQYTSDFGSDWQVATVKQGSKINLFDGVDAGASTAMTRNDVAQLALNSLQATMVEAYGSDGIKIEGDDFTVITGSTIEYRKVEVESEGSENYAGSTSGAKGLGYQQLCEKLYGTDLKLTVGQEDDFGFKGNKWEYGTGSDKEIGIYSTAKVVASYTTASEVTFGDLYKLGDWTADAITIQENGNTATGKVKFNTSDGNSSSLTWKGSKEEVSAFSGYDGAVVNIVDQDDDGVIDAVLVVYGYLAEVTKVNAATASADRNIELDVYDNATAQKITYETENYAKGDYVIVYPDAVLTDNNLSSSTELLKVEVAESVTGSCTAYTGSATNNYTAVTVDGTKYEVGATAKIKETVSLTDGEFTVYLLNGYAVAVMADDNYSADISGIVYVTATATKGVNSQGDEVYYVKTVGMDGTYTVIQTKVNPGSLTADTFYMMDKDSDGEYVFTAATDNKKLTDSIDHINNDNNEYYAVDTLKDATSLKPDTKSIVVDGDSNAKAYLTSNTRYIFVDGTKTTIVTGGITKLAPDATKVLVSKTDDAYEVEAMIFTGSYSASVGGDVLYIANATKTGENANGDTYEAYNMDGEKITITLESAPAAGKFYNYSVDGDGVYTLDEVGTATGGDDGAYYVTGTSVLVSKYGTLLTVGTSFADVEAANMVVVDLDGAEDVEDIEDLTGATGFNGAILIADDEVVIVFVTDMDKTA